MFPPQQNKFSRFLPVLIAVLAMASIYVFQRDARKEEVAAPPAQVTATDGSFSKALARGPLAGVIVHPTRRDLGAFTFANAKGETLDLSRWKGRVVLLNLWATWCTPCKKEMPDLAKLQTALGGADFEVVALSVDRKGLAASAAFLKETGVANLVAYVEPEGKSLAALQAIGLPATILIDRQGQEAARLLGPADWASPEAQTMVRALMAEK
jgi:thiol-disulfide isomerase/thioredoxin